MDETSVSQNLIAIHKSGNRIRMESIVAELQTLLAESVVPTIISYLTDNNPNVQAGSAWALGIIGDSQAIKPLVTALSDQDIRVSTVAATALSLIRDPAVDDLIAVFRNTNDRLIKFHTINALDQSYDPRVIDIFLEALTIRDDLIRKYAAYGLVKFKDKRAVDPLLKLVTSRDGYRNEVADASAWTLATIGDTRALRPIFRAMVAEIIWVPHALKEFGEPAVKLLLSGLKAKNPKRRAAAAAALGEMQETKALDPLITLLESDPEGDVRSSAAFALGYIGDKRAMDALTAALNDRHDNTRAQASRALDRLKSQPHTYP
jgi:HEAT repeat protein